MSFDYTNCDTLTPSTSLDQSQLSFVDIPKFSYRLRSKDASAPRAAPQYAFFVDPTNADFSQRQNCVIQFDVPADLDPSVLIYYKLTNFFQNHRRYVKSLNMDQLKGKPITANDLQNSDCKPLAVRDGKAIFPCGLIANSVFNGKYPVPAMVPILIDL
jgi:hypothetical protein